MAERQKKTQETEISAFSFYNQLHRSPAFSQQCEQQNAGKTEKNDIEEMKDHEK